MLDAAAIEARKREYVRPPRSVAKFRAADLLLHCAAPITVVLSNDSINFVCNFFVLLSFNTFRVRHRSLYDKLKATLHKSVEGNDGAANYQQSHLKETPAGESIGKFQEQNLQQIAQTNTTINRFLTAFIDHVIHIHH